MLVILYHGLQLVLSKTIKIGDTKYHIWCTISLPSLNGIISALSVDGVVNKL